MGCETLSEFLYLCFGLDPVPQMFKKVPLAVLRRLNMLIRIYIDIKQVEPERRWSQPRTLSFTFCNLLRFYLNLKQFVPQQCQEIEFLSFFTKFCESDSLTALTQGVEGPGGVDKDVQQELNIDFGNDQTFRSHVVNHPSSCITSLTNLESSAVTNAISEIEEIVSNECKIDSLRERGTALVDVEFTTFKWEALHP